MPTKWNQLLLWSVLLNLLAAPILFAQDFNLESPYNKSVLRFEMENDIVYSTDSNFTSGWSLQYHTKNYAGWEESRSPGFIKWVGLHFPSLSDKESIVRNSHGIGQNMLTPGDLIAETPQENDLPYAGTLTYGLSWQSFNRQTSRNFQITVGLLGEEAFAGETQEFVHDNLSESDDPAGWDTQRDTEPILNAVYHYSQRLVGFGQYTNDWGSQLNLDTDLFLGNLNTGIGMGIRFRFGWNIPEGFNSGASPPGFGIFEAAYLPKPASASPHSIDVMLGIQGTGLIYSVLYDGSLITDDDRSVERESVVFSGLFGLGYSYHGWFSVHLYFSATTDLLKEDSIPESLSKLDKTHTDVSFGALTIDVFF